MKQNIKAGSMSVVVSFLRKHERPHAYITAGCQAEGRHLLTGHTKRPKHLAMFAACRPKFDEYVRQARSCSPIHGSFPGILGSKQLILSISLSIEAVKNQGQRNVILKLAVMWHIV
jgi:hypothetical protein